MDKQFLYRPVAPARMVPDGQSLSFADRDAGAKPGVGYVPRLKADKTGCDANRNSGCNRSGSLRTNRFNRFRKANGHVFQGRYKALLLDGDAVGPVCHYIHLNPVRAGIVEPGALQA